jgi:hypothetical protein
MLTYADQPPPPPDQKKTLVLFLSTIDTSSISYKLLFLRGDFLISFPNLLYEYDCLRLRVFQL